MRFSGLEGSRIASSPLAYCGGGDHGRGHVGAHIGLLHAVPGRSFVLQASRLFVTIMLSLAALVAAAQVLRIRSSAKPAT